MSLTACIMNHRCLIAVSGEERATFLQGLITSDIYKLSDDTARRTGFLNPQGKYLFDAFVYQSEGRILLDVHESKAAGLLDHLQRYILRSKVTVQNVSDVLSVAALWNESGADITDNPLDGRAYVDSGNAGIGLRVIDTHARLSSAVQGLSNVGNADDYFRHRLSCGVCDPVEDLSDEDLFWAETGAEDLGAIDYDKGCYIGQEVTARIKHRGLLRRKIIAVRTGGTPSPLPCKLVTDVWDVDTLLKARQGYGIALVRLDRWEDAQSSMRMITAGDVPIFAYQAASRLSA